MMMMSGVHDDIDKSINSDYDDDVDDDNNINSDGDNDDDDVLSLKFYIFEG